MKTPNPFTPLVPASASASAGPINPVAPRAGAGASRCFRSDDLFGASREVLIEHEGGHYRLRLTQANKLILTK